MSQEEGDTLPLELLEKKEKKKMCLNEVQSPVVIADFDISKGSK